MSVGVIKSERRIRENRSVRSVILLTILLLPWVARGAGPAVTDVVVRFADGSQQQLTVSPATQPTTAPATRPQFRARREEPFLRVHLESLRDYDRHVMV